MSVSIETNVNGNKDFNVSAKYNPAWNPHYDFANPANQAEIEKMARYDEAFAVVYGGGAAPDSKEYKAAKDYMQGLEKKALGGKDGYDIGVNVSSDWGLNKVIDFKTENGFDTCIKDITVFPNNMLSLQSHNGRKERWEVQEGTLTLIMNAEVYEVSAKGVFNITNGKRDQVTDPAVAVVREGHWSIILPEKSIHCMINTSDAPVRVIETQTGITREADNKRYADQQRTKESPRATIPLTSKELYDSALLYWKIEREIANKPGLGFKVSFEPKAA